MAKNLVDIMDSIGLGEIMKPSANFNKLSQKPVKVDAINHKVGKPHRYKYISVVASVIISGTDI